MNKAAIWSLIKSVLITSIIAYILAAAVERSFLPGIWFLIFFVGQFIFFAGIREFGERVVIARTIKQVADEQNAVLQNTIGKQSLSMDCAYCNMTNQNVPVILNEENRFKCFSCSQENAIYMKFYAARTTQPLEVPSLSANE